MNDDRPVEVFVQLDALLKKLLALSDEEIAAAEPRQPFNEENDICFGKAGPTLRRLYTLLVNAQFSQPCLPFDFFIANYTKEKQTEIGREMCLSAIELEMLNWLFRAEVVRAFPDFHSAGLLEKLSMRKGWKVVASSVSRKSERNRILED